MHQHVHVAEAVPDFAEAGGHLGLVGQIGMKSRAFGAFWKLKLPGLLGRTYYRRQAGAFLRETPQQLLSQPSAGAGNHHDFMRQGVRFHGARPLIETAHASTFSRAVHPASIHSRVQNARSTTIYSAPLLRGLLRTLGISSARPQDRLLWKTTQAAERARCRRSTSS